MAKFIREVHCCDEYCDTRPDKVVIAIDERLAQRILKLARQVKRLDVYKIVQFDYTPDWKETGVKNPDWHVDCVTLDVTNDNFHWSSYIKHTNILLETEGISIKDLIKKFPHIKE